MKTRIRKVLQVAVGIAAFALLLRQTGWKQLRETFAAIDLLWFLPSLALGFAVQLLGSMNVSLLLRGCGHRVRTSRLFVYTMMSCAIGRVAPGKVGEVSLVWLLRRSNVPPGEALAVALLDKLVTFGVVCVIGALGLIPLIGATIPLAILAGSIVCGAGALCTIGSDRARALVKRYVLRKHAAWFAGFSSAFFRIIRSRTYLLANILVTVIRILAMCTCAWFVFRMFDQNIPIVYIAVAHSAMTIVTLIPISISGLGVRELTGTSLYHLIMGIPTAVAAGMMMALTVRLYILALIYYLLSLWLLGSEEKVRQD